MVFMAKIHQFFQFLALFLQNLINTNKIEVGNDKFDTKNVTIAVKLASKFFSKMQQHVNDNSIPKDVPAFARSSFVEAMGWQFTLEPKGNDAKKQSASRPANGTGGGKRKPNGKEQQGGQKKPKKEFLDKSLKIGLFHVKKGTLASKALPDKSTLKDGTGIYMDFCSHKKSVIIPISSARMGSITLIGKMFPTRIRSLF